jgi:hypothetical protein
MHHGGPDAIPYRRQGVRADGARAVGAAGQSYYEPSPVAIARH